MPFWVDFTVKDGDPAADIANNVAKLIKTHHVFLQHKYLVNLPV